MRVHLRSPDPVQPEMTQTSPSPSSSSSSLSARSSAPPRSRQTRIQEHLRAVKPSALRSKPIRSSAPPAMAPVAPAGARHSLPAGSVAAELAASAPLVQIVRGGALLPAAALLVEDPAQARLDTGKRELLQRLSLYGYGAYLCARRTLTTRRLNPRTEVLDEGLRLLEGSASPTAEALLLTLSSAKSLQPPIYHHFPPSTVAPRVYQPSPVHLSPLTTTFPDGDSTSSFATLESPTTPALLHSSLSERRGSATSDTTRKSSASSADQPAEPRTPTQTSLALPSTTPYQTKNERLMAFQPKTKPLRVAVVPRPAGALVAAQVTGMGRIIISKNILEATFGPHETERVMNDAARVPVPTLFGHCLETPARLAESLPILESFSSQRNAPGAPFEPTPAMLIDDRMSSIKLWLDSPEVAEEDPRDSWSCIPKEWDRELDAYAAEVHRMATPAGDEEMVEEVRVGGKSVRVLLRAKKRRVELLSDQSPASSQASTSTFKRGKFNKGKGKMVDKDLCLCGDTEVGGATIACDECAATFHLACLEIARPRAGLDWFCFRCTGTASPSVMRTSTKRNSTASLMMTPTLSFAEPTLVESSSAPSSQSNFYRITAQPDQALAPSPQSSPTTARRMPPASPQHSRSSTAGGSIQRLLQDPVTPSRADYSPRSPTLFRTARSRTVSQYDEAGHAHQWVAGEESSLFEGDRAGGLLASLDDDDLQPRSWHDMTTTPSRSLSSAALGWGLSTPITTSSRRGHKGMHLTPSQDFLSGLHSNHVVHSREDSSTTYAYAQRLFANSMAGPTTALAFGGLSSPSRIASPSNAYISPSSPLAPKRISPLGAGLHSPLVHQKAGLSHAFVNPFPSPPGASATPSATLTPLLDNGDEDVSSKALDRKEVSNSSHSSAHSGLGIGFETSSLHRTLHSISRSFWTDSFFADLLH